MSTGLFCYKALFLTQTYLKIPHHKENQIMLLIYVGQCNGPTVTRLTFTEFCVLFSGNVCGPRATLQLTMQSGEQLLHLTL